MGKGDRRGKVKPQGIPDLAPIKPRGKQPREKGRFAKPQDDAARVALTARCHHYTTKAATTEERDKAKAPHMGFAIGWVMQHECPGDTPRLWQIWQAWCQAELTYSRRIIGLTGSPKGATMQYVADKMQTDTGHTVDLRTAEERDQDAVKAWMRWRGYLGHLSADEATALHGVRNDTGKALWRDRKPTRYGVSALAALNRLAHVADG
jgi:hypothetical protein